ncbi:MAG: branched-chain amino acid ABC transporter permease [Desulfobacterales bacterium CG07_land_8_20_14_0_80_52_14]|nr:MAG: branched-chain amino acid ABC transporter permease [Desulfobacterales bacterium CG23_combo_of_CG06-09_8_20_14_all_52_9]PIU48918.1 MAG: branched-chain amino acid ABC transporter permease [Desulfobacterales bacterium CG07_land_8_20_14_0_80_52_14]
MTKTDKKHFFSRLFSGIPVLGWLLGVLIAVLLERYLGEALAEILGLPKIPVLFGFVIMLKKPALIPGSLAFVILIYILPIWIIARLSAPATNAAAGFLVRRSVGLSAMIHLALLYACIHIWSDISAYRVLALKLTLISIMLTLSLNVVNGYMGEFSCSHPGFMALGAYVCSIFTVGPFINDRFFDQAILPLFLAPYIFPVALIFGGLAAAAGALFVAIPSFRTRGDYLAIISLAFMFIVKSLIENLEFVGGPRGLGGQPDLASLPTVFIWTVLCVWIINNFVRSTLGKAMNAVRDDELAAAAMTVNTRNTKMTAFLFAAFWAGVAGGLFAHVLRYVNPGTFGVQNLAEVLAMVYFGGLNSVYGSIVGAVSLNLLGEALRPLELFKWIIIPLLLILVMIFRPKGLVAFKEFDPRRVLQPKLKSE